MTRENAPREKFPLAVLGIALGVQTLTHLFWLSLSTDAGGLAVPWLMMHGRRLFAAVIEHRGPARFFIISWTSRGFGLDLITTDRLLNVTLVLVSTILVAAAAFTWSPSRRRMSATAALITWVLWEPVYGNMLFYFDSMLGTTVLAGMLAWTTFERRWFGPPLAGLFLGAAVLCKQQGVAAILFFAIWIIAAPSRSRGHNLAAFVAGALVLPIGAALYFWWQDTLGGYFYWIWTFNLMAGRSPLEHLDGNLLRKLLLSSVLVPPFLAMPARGMPGGRRLLIAGMWIAMLAALSPRMGEQHVMAALPVSAVISGLVLAATGDSVEWREWTRVAPGAVSLAGGLIAALAAAWIVTCASPYVPGSLGPAAVPAYDEFKPLAVRVGAHARPGDTLAVLPELESTAQLHVLTGLLPVGTWAYGNFWMLRAPGLVERLLGDWRAQPPDWVVRFPALEADAEPYIDELVDFVTRDYVEIDRVAAVPFAGEALLYRRRTETR